MEIRIISTMALAVGLAITAACAGPTPAPAPVTAALGANGVQQVTVKVGSGVAFNPSVIAVKAGQPVQVSLENIGGADHDFFLDDGGSEPVKIFAGDRQTARGTFTISQPGTYTFVCTIPGHALAGMRGTIMASSQ